MILLAINIAATLAADSLQLFPRPMTLKNGLHNQMVIVPPCSYGFRFKGASCAKQNCPFFELIEHYRRKLFKCEAFVPQPAFFIEIYANDSFPHANYQKKDQGYKLVVQKPGIATIIADKYVGVVRAIQTLAQLFKFFGKKYYAVVCHLPINISDQPTAQFRGLAVDAASRFLPIQLLRQTIDGMMYSKLNTLTINYVDNHYFRLLVPGYQDLLDQNNPSASYSENQIAQLLKYALIRGVKVIPRLDLFSSTIFSKSQKLNSVLINSFLDPSVASFVYRDIFNFVSRLFLDDRVNVGRINPYIVMQYHNGTVMKDLKFSNVVEVPFFLYSFIAKQILNDNDKYLIIEGREAQHTSMNEKVQVYQCHIYLEQNSISSQTKFAKLNRVVLAPSTFNLGTGNLNQFGSSTQPYNVFSRFYQIFQLKEPVIGTQAFNFGQVNNRWSHLAKVFMRASASGEATWFGQSSNSQDRTRRLVSLQKSMEWRGLPVSPLTCQQCERNIESCF